MSIAVERITIAQAEKVMKIEEGQFADLKAKEIAPAKLTKTISALANSDGGDLYIGIGEVSAPPEKRRVWQGFADQEAANGHIQPFEQLFPLGTDFQYEFLRCEPLPGLVLHVQVNKTQDIKKASNNIPYIRRGAQNLPADPPEMLRRLEYTKGLVSFESELVNTPKEAVTTSEVVERFIREVVPNTTPEAWLRKQVILRGDQPTVSAVLLFADEPQAVLPKRCGIKIYRYKTKEPAGFREALAFTPKTVEGAMYAQIKQAVAETTAVAESIPKMGTESLERITYPSETLHEIITNAVLHRDYSVADDVHIRIFDNRIEVQSPGRLPAHITVKNILDERFARNGASVRILNKFPDPPNQDVGEGLNTAFAAMHKLGLKAPVIVELDNAVLVTIKHESLASPEEAIMDYLEHHETINNKTARGITHIPADYRVKRVFNRMVDKGLIEQVPGTERAQTCYRKKVPSEPSAPAESPQASMPVSEALPPEPPTSPDSLF
ncbi:MAG TPA: ATP-binding protein [Urbifossiella sp.]|nr:ATP-binding protein [Urbifossiella sp.]